MNSLPEVDPALLTRFLVELLKTPSPTGFAHEAIAYTEHVFGNLPGVQTSIGDYIHPAPEQVFEVLYQSHRFLLGTDSLPQ